MGISMGISTFTSKKKSRVSKIGNVKAVSTATEPTSQALLSTNGVPKNLTSQALHLAELGLSPGSSWLFPGEDLLESSRRHNGVVYQKIVQNYGILPTTE